MINGSVIPNGQIVDILPSVSDLQVVVVNHKANKPLKELFRFGFCESIDLLCMVSKCENRLPARDWVCTDYGVDCFKDCFLLLASLSIVEP